MRARATIVVAVNLAVLLATRLAFDDWVRHRFGYLDFDVIGPSGVAWVPLVLATVAACGAAFWISHARWVAIAGMGLLGIIIADHVLGALRDGSVSVQGVVTGVLMALQLVTIAIGLTNVRMPARGIFVVALVGIGLVVIQRGL